MAPAQQLHALLDQTGWIHSLARRLVADPHLAADLAQDTAMQALEERPDSSRPLRGWLATVMRNQLSKLRRGERNRSARESSSRKDDLAPAAQEVVERAETHRNVVLAVLALEEPYRSTLLMRFFEQLSYDQIAARTGVTRAAVNSRVTRGLVQLRVRLENTYGGDRRALCLALTPLAKLPTGVATTTILGLKTMHIAIGTAAATLVAASVSVGVFGGGREPAQPRNWSPSEPLSSSANETELQVPLTLRIPANSSSEALAAPQREEHKQDKKVAEQNVWRTEVSRALALSPTVEGLTVNTGSGDVVVQGSTSGRLEVVGRVRARTDYVQASELTEVFEDHVEILEEDGRLIVRDAHSRSKGWTVDLRVSVPVELPILANSGSGDVHVKIGKGKVMANTGSGDVLVQLPDGHLSDLAANTGSGDVRVEVLSVEGDLEGNSGSGDVSVLLADPSSPGHARLNSGSGDLMLVVPASVIGAFDLETQSGEVQVMGLFGIEVHRSVSGARSASGTIGNGTAKYRMRSGSGDLILMAGNSLPKKDR